MFPTDRFAADSVERIHTRILGPTVKIASMLYANAEGAGFHPSYYKGVKSTVKSAQVCGNL